MSTSSHPATPEEDLFDSELDYEEIDSTAEETPSTAPASVQPPSPKKPRPSKEQRKKRSADLTDESVPLFKKGRPLVLHPKITLRPQAVAQACCGNDVQKMFYALMDALDEQNRRMQ
ncbi:hypothetical protein Y032_0105g3719 [Ancylostoma ceylanicum]|uniref:Uncharacterized protein n=1 Tax=Ancylostoma ceylanicum TaxID=53326 RepID=A0A016TFL3_9BILA|nr:hypothetical protein Y032_0105g3719 [Ancylostoma ceylanicum]